MLQFNALLRHLRLHHGLGSVYGLLIEEIKKVESTKDKLTPIPRAAPPPPAPPPGFRVPPKPATNEPGSCEAMLPIQTVNSSSALANQYSTSLKTDGDLGVLVHKPSRLRYQSILLSEYRETAAQKLAWHKRRSSRVGSTKVRLARKLSRSISPSRKPATGPGHSVANSVRQRSRSICRPLRSEAQAGCRRAANKRIAGAMIPPAASVYLATKADSHALRASTGWRDHQWMTPRKRSSASVAGRNALAFSKSLFASSSFCNARKQIPRLKNKCARCGSLSSLSVSVC
jgi:hypothetical protein